MEQSNYNDPAKSPAIQEMILSNQLAGIAVEISKRLDIPPIEALKMFYPSKTCADLHDKDTGLYLYSDAYVADEFIIERQKQHE